MQNHAIQIGRDQCERAGNRRETHLPESLFDHSGQPLLLQRDIDRGCRVIESAFDELEFVPFAFRRQMPDEIDGVTNNVLESRVKLLRKNQLSLDFGIPSLVEANCLVESNRLGLTGVRRRACEKAKNDQEDRLGKALRSSR